MINYEDKQYKEIFDFCFIIIFYFIVIKGYSYSFYVSAILSQYFVSLQANCSNFNVAKL